LWPNTKVRYHPVDHIINDIKVLVNSYKADCITFVDELFIIDESRLIEICHALKKNGFDNLKFRASGRVDILSRLSESTWKLLNNSGFVGFAIGLESGSQRMLDSIGKDITLEQIYKVDKILTDYHFYKTYNFMSCFPGESINDVKDTLRLIANIARTSKYCPYPFGLMNKFLPLPNTELFSIAKNNGFIPPKGIKGWTLLDYQNCREKVVRPWVTKRHLHFVNKSNDLIRELNNIFTGENADHLEIECTIRKIETLIEDASFR